MRVVGVCVAQNKPGRKRGRRVRVGEEEEEERPGRKAGEGSRDGWRWGFKREGNTTQRPGVPLPPRSWGGAEGGTAHPGNGLNPDFLGGLQDAGGGCWVPRMLSTHPDGMQDACVWAQDGARLGGGAGITQHPTASSCSRGGKAPPRQQDPATSRGNGAVANSRRQRAIRSVASKRACCLGGVELLGSLPF